MLLHISRLGCCKTPRQLRLIARVQSAHSQRVEMIHIAEPVDTGGGGRSLRACATTTAPELKLVTPAVGPASLSTP